MNATAEKVMSNFEQAMQANLKMQEQMTRCWTSLWGQPATSAPMDWQRNFMRFTAMAGGALPGTQRRMEEFKELMDENTRSSAELMKKAFEAAQNPLSVESQAKWMEFWADSMRMAQSNARAMTEIGARALNAWINIMNRAGETASPKTA